MRVVRDLLGGNTPPAMDLYFNAQVAADGGDKVWSGALTKVMDIADVDNGRFLVPNHAATRGLNIFGIIQETVGAAATDGYLPTDTTYGMIRRKITPVFPSTLIRAEYMRQDQEGTANYETLAAAAAGTAMAATSNAIDTDDLLIGGWLYFYTGDNAGQLHYIIDSANTNDVITLATATPYAVTTTDRVLVILPAFVDELVFNAISTGIKSDTDDTNWTDEVVGIDVWMSGAPGVAMTRLERDLHDGTNVGANAQFFHDFVIGEASVFTGTGIA